MDRLVRRVREATLRFDQTGATWRAVVYENELNGQQVVAFVQGELHATEPTLVRMHAGGTIGDLFASHDREGGRNLRESIERIEQHGSGVIVYFPPKLSLADELAAIGAARTGVTAADGPGAVLHGYGLGAQVLANLGVRRLRLMTNNPRRIAGLAGFGLEVVECLSLETPPPPPRSGAVPLP
jgi:3,4-dihydroxy 2-butanone 4-phosphate synthase/GTP cyclohydrolase II